jgi:Tol biopolymer transport system component
MGLLLLCSASMSAKYVEKILFSTLDSYNQSQIFAVSPDGSKLAQITCMPGLGATDPAVSPDGTRIVFITSMIFGKSAVMVMNADGANLRQLYPSSGYENAQFTNPRFSKKGNSLFVLRCENGGQAVMEINLTTKGITRKGTFKSSALQTISNGDILYSSPIICSRPDLYRCKTDGTGAQIVARNAASPDISYDGKLIAFHRSDVYTNIFTIDDKHIETQLTNNKYCNYDAAINPNGTKIAFCSYGVDVNPGSDFKICSMYKDGIGLRDVATGFHSRVNGTVWASLSAEPNPVTPKSPWGDDWENMINPPKPDIYASDNKSSAEYGFNRFTDDQMISNFVKSRLISTYYIKIRNCGNIAAPFAVKAVVGNMSGWTLKMMNENNVVITNDITDIDGLTTPVIAGGKTYNFRLETSPASILKDQAVLDVVLTAYSTIDASVNDKITVRTTKEVR